MKIVITNDKKDLFFDLAGIINYWKYEATYLIMFKDEAEKFYTDFGDWEDIKKNNVFFIKKISQWAKLDDELCCNLDNLHLKILVLKWCKFEPKFGSDEYKKNIIYISKKKIISHQ